MWANKLVADQGLNWLSTNAAKVCFCTTRPSNKADATGLEDVAGVMCAITTDVQSTLITALADSTWGSGLRKVDISSTPAAVTVLSSGGIGHIAIIDGSTLQYVTTVATTRNVTTADTITMGAWQIDIFDPSSSTSI